MKSTLTKASSQCHRNQDIRHDLLVLGRRKEDSLCFLAFVGRSSVISEGEPNEKDKYLRYVRGSGADDKGCGHRGAAGHGAHFLLSISQLRSTKILRVTGIVCAVEGHGFCDGHESSRLESVGVVG